MWRWLHDLAFRGRAVFDRDTADRELSEELQFHRSMDIASLRERGLSASQAEWEAGRHFGTLASEAERAREGLGRLVARGIDLRRAPRTETAAASPRILRARARGTRPRNWRERIAGQRRRQPDASSPALWKRESRSRLLDGPTTGATKSTIFIRERLAVFDQMADLLHQCRSVRAEPRRNGRHGAAIRAERPNDVRRARRASGVGSVIRRERRPGWRTTRDRHQRSRLATGFRRCAERDWTSGRARWRDGDGDRRHAARVLFPDSRDPRLAPAPARSGEHDVQGRISDVWSRARGPARRQRS